MDFHERGPLNLRIHRFGGQSQTHCHDRDVEILGTEKVLGEEDRHGPHVQALLAKREQAQSRRRLEPLTLPSLSH